jgi:hypothetical protein
MFSPATSLFNVLELSLRVIINALAITYNSTLIIWPLSRSVILGIQTF